MELQELFGFELWFFSPIVSVNQTTHHLFLEFVSIPVLNGCCSAIGPYLRAQSIFAGV